MMLRQYIISFALLAMMAGCSSETILREEDDITTSTDPMRFTGVGEDVEDVMATRASKPLTTGFLVGCWKSYGLLKQQTVMSNYQVEYRVDGWNNSSQWNYEGVNDQYLRYWDYSNFPYRFHALAPCPDNTAGFVLSDTKLTIPNRYTYSAQTCINGLVTPADAEPFMLAQVQRNDDGTDTDLIAGRQINTSSTSKNRHVWLPFHHLNSKIRFGIYHTTPWLTANNTYIKNLTINVTSPQFAVSASGYADDTNQNLHPWTISTGNAGFTGVDKIDPTPTMPHQIFRFDGGADVEGNDLIHCQTRQTAYFLQCPDGMMQIPQEGVQMTVSFDLYLANGTLYQSFTDVPVRLELSDDTFQDAYDWRQGMLYTYYLVIGEVEHKLEITFTATLTPWEDVTGSLSTDLEK